MLLYIPLALIIISTNVNAKVEEPSVVIVKDMKPPTEFKLDSRFIEQQKYHYYLKQIIDDNKQEVKKNK
jgi:hypothetical protein